MLWDLAWLTFQGLAPLPLSSPLLECFSHCGNYLVDVAGKRLGLVLMINVQPFLFCTESYQLWDGKFMGPENDKRRRSVAQWTVSEVCAWLNSRPFGAHGGPVLEAVSNHAISGKALLRLTEETMERMGIMPQSLCQELLHEVLCLRIQQEMEDLLHITDAEG